MTCIICFAVYSRRGFKMCFIIDTDTHSSNRFSRPFNNIVCCMQECVECERCCECQYAHTAWLVWSSAMFNAYISRDFSHQSNIFGFFFFFILFGCSAWMEFPTLPLCIVNKEIKTASNKRFFCAQMIRGCYGNGNKFSPTRIFHIVRMQVFPWFWFVVHKTHNNCSLTLCV